MPVKMLRLRRSETLSISSLTSWKGSTGPKLCRPSNTLTSAVLETRVCGGAQGRQAWELYNHFLAKVSMQVNAMIYEDKLGGIVLSSKGMMQAVCCTQHPCVGEDAVLGLRPGPGEGSLTGRANA